MPCAAIGPETRILSPGRTCCGPSSKPGRTNPMPAVLMYTPSPLPSPPPSCHRSRSTPRRCVRPRHRLGDDSESVQQHALFEDQPYRERQGCGPADSEVVDRPIDRQIPDIAAGKKRGAPRTKSVLNASFIPAMSSTAESPSCCRTPANSVPLNDGTNSAEISSADNRPPPPCPMTIEVWSRRGGGQVQFSRSGARSRADLKPTELVVRRARPPRWNHPGAKGERGVHSLPNAEHSLGLIGPCSTSPERHNGDSTVVMPSTSKRFSAS